ATAYVPFGIDRVRFSGRPRGRLWAHAVLRPGQEAGREVFTADVLLFEEAGRVVCAIEGLHLKRAERGALLRGLRGPDEGWLSELAWPPLPALAPPDGTPPEQAGAWVILADRGGTGDSLAVKLRRLGARCQLARPGTGASRLGGDDWQIDPTSPEDFARVLD